MSVAKLTMSRATRKMLKTSASTSKRSRKPDGYSTALPSVCSIETTVPSLANIGLGPLSSTEGTMALAVDRCSGGAVGEEASTDKKQS
jgi:hypothetical protein